MAYALRHSHIALFKTLPALAKAAGEAIAVGEDDFGPYSYFDLTVGSSEARVQRVRFASHEGDAMVHMLAERIADTPQLAEALWRVGIGRRGLPQTEEISISRDQGGHPVRDENEVLACLLDLYRLEYLKLADDEPDLPMEWDRVAFGAKTLKVLK